MWKIEFYTIEKDKSPVADFIRNLITKERAKIARYIDLLKENGIDLKFPFTLKISGEKYKDLWELRIKFSSNIIRIIYFLHIGNTFILLHGFRKKTQKHL